MTTPPPAVTARPDGGRHSWRDIPSDSTRLGHAAWRWIGRLLFSAFALLLVAVLVQLLLSVRRPAPIISFIATGYRAPYGPLPMTGEDRALLKGLGVPGRSFLAPVSAIVSDGTSLLGTAAVGADLLPGITRAVQDARPGGPTRDALIVYITAVGIVDAEGRACLVPPSLGDDPIAVADDNFLPVPRLLSALRAAVPPRTGIVVVLDCGRETLAWPLGIDAPSFPAAVETAVDEAGHDRLWVLLPASAGQRPLTSPAQGGSGFAIHFVRGFRGAADASPWGDGNGKVTIGELGRYLRTRVDEWAMAVFGTRQTPLLLPRDDSGPLQVAWAGSVEPRLGAATGEAVDDWWLSERWHAAERVRETAISDRPLRWAAYESLVLRSEHLRRAGVDAADRQGTNDALAEQIESSLRVPLTTLASIAPDSRLAKVRVARLNSEEQRRRGDVFASLQRFVEMAATTKTATGQQAATAATPRDPDAWLQRATDGWAWLLQRLDAKAPIDHVILLRWLEWIGPEPVDAIVPTQVHALRMLARWTDPQDWARDPAAFAGLIDGLAASREVALAWNVRLDRFRSQRTRQLEADRVLRQAWDLAFVGGPEALAEARARTTQAREALVQLAAELREQDRCIETFDTVRAELPVLAAWWVEEQRHGTGDERASSQVDWQELLGAFDEYQTIFQQVLVQDGEATIDRPGFMAVAEGKRARLDDLVSGLRSDYLTHCEFLTTRAADSPATLGGLVRALAIPIVRGEQRVQMLRRVRALESRFAAAFAMNPDRGAEPLPPPDPLAVLTGWVTVRNERVHPAVAALLSERPQVDSIPDTPAEASLLAGRQAAAVRDAARTLPDFISDVNRRCAAIEAVGTGDERQFLLVLGEGANVVRRLATVICDRPLFLADAEPARKFLAMAWHTRLVHLATLALEDFWGAVEPTAPPFCVRRAGMLLDAAAGIARLNHVRMGDIARQEVADRLDQIRAAGDAFAAIEATPERIALASASGGEPPLGSLRLRAAPAVPDGIATVWLAAGIDSPPLVALGSAAGRPSPRIGAEVGSDPSPTAWTVDRAASQRLEESRTSILDMVVWFRGHRLVRGLPVAPAALSRTTGWSFRPPEPTRVTVRGDVPRQQAVALVFDCSGSMGRRIADGRTRLDAGREAVAALLDPLATAGNWNVSLWLYGHRTRWSRDRSGRYTAGLTEAGERAKAQATTAGEPFTLVPGDDVEQVLPMQSLTPGVVREIQSLLAPIEPGGETPLYRAISEAIGTDFDGPRAAVPGHVLVVTDGANDQSGGQIVTAAGVEDQLARKNARRADPIRIDIIGFALEADSMERALRMGQARDLADGSGGRFSEARDAEALSRSLRESLRVLRWRARGPGVDGQPTELGGSLALPLSLPGQRRAYDVVLDAGPGSPQRRIAAENNTSLELHVVGGGRSLEFRRYDGGTEQGLRDSRSDLFDPEDPRRRCFVGAHLATRAGDTVTFPLSVQNDDPTSYSPRPAELWVRIQPQRDGKRVGAPFVFYELTIQPSRPVPVFDLIAPNWPREADQAAIQAWFRFEPVPADLTIPVGDLVPGVERPLQLAGFPDTTVTVTLQTATAPDALTLTVVEQHPLAAADDLPTLKVTVAEGCLESVHVVEPGTGRVRHTFTVAGEGGRVSPATRLTITDAQRILANAVSTSAAGPLVVPVPTP